MEEKLKGENIRQTDGQTVDVIYTVDKKFN